MSLRPVSEAWNSPVAVVSIIKWNSRTSKSSYRTNLAETFLEYYNLVMFQNPSELHSTARSAPPCTLRSGVMRAIFFLSRPNKRGTLLRACLLRKYWFSLSDPGNLLRRRGVVSNGHNPSRTGSRSRDWNLVLGLPAADLPEISPSVLSGYGLPHPVPAKAHFDRKYGVHPISFYILRFYINHRA